MIEVLQNSESLLSSRIQVSALEPALFTDLLSETRSCTFYRARIDELTEKVMEITARRVRELSKPHFLHTIFDHCRETFNTDICFFPLNGEQEYFDEWLFAQNSPLRRPAEEFLSAFEAHGRTEFSADLLLFFANHMESLEVRDKADKSIAAMLLFRSMFDAAFRRSPKFFFPGSVGLVESLSKSVVCGDLTPPPRYLPPFEPDSLVADVFQQVAQFRTAGDHLASMALYTNPLDMLWEVNEALKCIHRVVVINTPPGEQSGEVFAFETTFTLFCGSVLCSGQPEFEATAKFIIDFEPKGRFSAAFEYAQATISAVLVQLASFPKHTS
jgi:hypothetical protein